ncbi:MCE family protein [Mycobacterium sp. MYCO198283]|uniref:MCE family protein n=1 Tax=Mycobacterium sp. MYCO198283 TaxID=2883505 RepID=UPI001E384C6E|nr:MCE family protein [Mycobacterium sp. MYCO198283]MCG5434176.1 MCE family protein [Mycobacterium sp. MYCO198283]
MTASVPPGGVPTARHQAVKGTRKETPGWVRPATGLATVGIILAIFAVAVLLFRGDFTRTVPVTVMSDRAGLVMNPDAKVKMRGVQVGFVESITSTPDGKAKLTLAMNPDQLKLIPANVLVNIASTTVFGAKFVQLVPPAKPATDALHPGAVLDSGHVTVEINTVFEQLTQVLGSIEPQKLNETLGAIAQAFNGRGEKLGDALVDFDRYLATIEPSLPNLSRDLELAPQVLGAYADAAPDLMTTARSATQVSQTFVDEQQNLDALLVSATGLADVGNPLLTDVREPLSTTLRQLGPTAQTLNKYNQALWCGLSGMYPLATGPDLPDPGVAVNVSFVLGIERYRYPGNLPKVNASGGPQCTDLPRVPFGKRTPYLVMDNGANAYEYGNQGWLINSEGLKNLLYGPLDGPPRNTAQVGQPG